MSEIAPPREAPRRRRADAEHNIAAILDAAVQVLGRRPDASMAEIAAAAGVTRQTVYAHYESRELLLRAVAERALAQALAAIDAVKPQRGAAPEALARLVPVWWHTVGRHARVLEALADAFPDSRDVHDLHAPILTRLQRVIRRGQRSGDFDRSLPAGWIAAAFLGLMHTAADEVAAGRLDPDEAGRALERTIPRLCGVGGGAGRR
jgi:AcrR family transcriptional regulator